MKVSQNSLFERAKAVLPPAAGRATNIGVVKGEGAYLIAEDGRRYLDFASGVAVTNVGHNHPRVVAAVKDQIDDLIHGGHNVVYYPSYVELAEKINELTGGSNKVYFSNSGAEANEGAVKLAKKVTKRPAVIAFKRAFHGRTLAAASLTASDSLYRKDYEGLLPSVYHTEYPYPFRSVLSGEAETERCIRQLEELFQLQIDPEMVAAIIMEPIQGEGGYIVPPASFVRRIREICDEHGILLIFDEIQTAFGRTGKMFAYEHFGVKPDILTLAKGIASGFPLSAVVASRELMDQWLAGTHGGTYGGNPVACAASLATIELLEDGLLENAMQMGDYFRERLLKVQRDLNIRGEVRGLGLMIGFEFVNADGSPNSSIVGDLRSRCIEDGLLLLACGTDKNVIRFIPPTIVTKEQIDEAITILSKHLKTLIE